MLACLLYRLGALVRLLLQSILLSCACHLPPPVFVLTRYVVKAGIPVFTVAYCALALHKSYPPLVYAALVPTVLGVALAR